MRAARSSVSPSTMIPQPSGRIIVPPSPAPRAVQVQLSLGVAATCRRALVIKLGQVLGVGGCATSVGQVNDWPCRPGRTERLGEAEQLAGACPWEAQTAP
eukprot:8178512-Alexandrium_andersonii.AAC.1